MPPKGLCEYTDMRKNEYIPEEVTLTTKLKIKGILRALSRH